MPELSPQKEVGNVRDHLRLEIDEEMAENDEATQEQNGTL